MKRLALTAIAGLAVLAANQAMAAPSQWKVTGGGQIIASFSAPSTGSGATLAFTAQGTGGPARGQLQYNDHTAVKFHARVTCLVVANEDTDDDASTPDQRVARIAGTYTNAAGEPANFQLFVEDRDFGGPQNANEFLMFNPEADDDTCDQEVEATQELGRGNIVIHKEKSP